MITKNRFYGIVILTILIACNKTDPCALVFQNNEPSFLLLNIIDGQTGQNILLGDEATINIDNLEITGISNGESIVLVSFPEMIEGDSVLIVCSFVPGSNVSSLSPGSCSQKLGTSRYITAQQRRT